MKTKDVALGGVLLALSLATLFIASFIPGVELSLFALSSFYIIIMVIRTSAKGGWIFYAASFLLAFLLIPNKIALIPYGMFFGIYGLIKYYIERIEKQTAEVLLKLLFFNGSWGISFYIFKDVFLGNIKLPDYSPAVLVIGIQVLFLFYDYILTLLIGFYQKRFRNS